MSTVTTWPESVEIRTAEAWRALASDEAWASDVNRKIVAHALKTTQLPASHYARITPLERVDLLIGLQEQLVPGSTKPAAAKTAAAPAAAKKAAAATSTKAPAAAAAAPTKAATGGGSTSVEAFLESIKEGFAALKAQNDELRELVAAGNARGEETNSALKVLLLAPQNRDALELCADPDVLATFANQSLSELAGGGN